MSAFNPASLANLTSKSHQPANQLFSFLSDLKPDASKTNGVNKSDHQEVGKVESSSMFSFGSKMQKSEDIAKSSSQNTNDRSDVTSSIPFSFGNNKNDANKAPNTSSSFSFGNAGNSFLNSANKKEETTVQNENKTVNVNHYYAKLKGLNQSVAKWINKHVEDNPLINLQPIFKDYENFFEELEKEYHKTDTTGSAIKTDSQKENKGFNFASKPAEKIGDAPMNTFKFNANPIEKSSNVFNKNDSPSSLFKFGAPSSTNDKIGEEKSSILNKTEQSSPSLFKFGAPTSDKTAGEKLGLGSPASTFKFGASSTSSESTSKTDQTFKFQPITSTVPTQSPPQFGFGSTSSGLGGFSFTPNPVNSSGSKINFGSIPPPSNSTENKDEEESEEPPKVEVKEVEEEGQIYTIRCKLFVRKDSTFVEKGVGNLFLKPVPDSEKVQVIVRGYNSLASVLCNFILSKSMPIQRMGKNNVMIVCIPTPESKPPPIPVLIKVKTGEDADHLLETLEKHKK